MIFIPVGGRKAIAEHLWTWRSLPIDRGTTAIALLLKIWISRGLRSFITSQRTSQSDEWSGRSDQTRPDQAEHLHGLLRWQNRVLERCSKVSGGWSPVHNESSYSESTRYMSIYQMGNSGATLYERGGHIRISSKGNFRVRSHGHNGAPTCTL